MRYYNSCDIRVLDRILFFLFNYTKEIFHTDIQVLKVHLKS